MEKNRRGLLRSLSAWVIIIGLLNGVSHATAGGMATPVGFNVNETGAANFNIPIEIPPGTAGIAPLLSLNYNSQGGNGMLGMGWSLGGLSAIYRCGRTLIQDGVKDGVNYNSNDRYCLDGQRLVAVTGAYGANATEYRTERESFTKIISYGTAGSGPAWFKAWTKAGQIIEFGNTTDSAIEAQGKTDIRAWAVNKISDTKGNYFTVSYTEDNANGDYRPDRIDYTGNASANPVLTPYNSVRFVYQSRADITPMYQAGSVIKTMMRLANVQTYAKVGATDTLVKDYQLAYDTSTATQRLRVISVTECAGDGVCLPPTTVEWQAGDSGLMLPNYSAPALPASLGGYSTSNSNPSYIQIGDFNGDGKTDYMWISANGDGRWLMAYGTENGFTLPSYNAPVLPATLDGYATSNLNPSYIKVGDFNGDGKADYMWMSANGDGRWLIAYGTENGFTLPSYSAPVLPASLGGYSTSNSNPSNIQIGDFNGDGKTDYMWIPANGDGRWLIAYSTGSGFTLPDYNNPALPASVGGYLTGWYNLWGNIGQFVGDFNGDGKADFMYKPRNGDQRWLIAYGTGTGFTLPDYNNPALPLYAGGQKTSWDYEGCQYVGDFNGDGKADFIYLTNAGAWLIAYSTGTGFTLPDYNNPAIPLDEIGYGDSEQLVGDFNGDGKADLMYVPNYGPGHWKIAYGTGKGFTLTGDNNPALPMSVGGYYTYPVEWLSHRYVGDFNGDGKADYIWKPAIADGRWLIAYSNTPSKQVDALATVTTGLGTTTTLAYKPITDSSIYTKDTGTNAAVYPYLDLQAPLYVVSSATLPTGIGNTRSTTYKYFGAKAHLTGGGFLGFRQFDATDDATGIKTSTVFRQDYPYQGLPTSVSVTQNTSQLKSITNTWDFDTFADTVLPIATANGSKHHFPKLTQSVESNWDLNGAALPVVTTANQYDIYGNATQVTVSTPDGYSKTTNNTYTNDLTNWYLGRLTRSTVTSTAP